MQEFSEVLYEGQFGGREEKVRALLCTLSGSLLSEVLFCHLDFYIDDVSQ